MDKIEIDDKIETVEEFYKAVEEFALYRLKEGHRDNTLWLMMEDNVICIPGIPFHEDQKKQNEVVNILKRMFDSFRPKATILSYEGVVATKDREPTAQEIFVLHCFDRTDHCNIIYDVVRGQGNDIVIKRRDNNDTRILRSFPINKIDK